MNMKALLLWPTKNEKVDYYQIEMLCFCSILSIPIFEIKFGSFELFHHQLQVFSITTFDEIQSFCE